MSRSTGEVLVRDLINPTIDESELRDILDLYDWMMDALEKAEPENDTVPVEF